MFDSEDRKELVEILDKQYQDARDIIVNNEVVPQGMTHNRGRVGVTIIFRKIYPNQEEKDD